MVQIPLGYRLLSVILYGWLCVVALGNVASIIAHLLTATSFWKGLQDVQGWYSPFNLTNWVYELLLLSPALMAFWLRKWWYSSRNRALLGHSQQAQKRHARQSTPFFQHAIIDR